MQRPLPLWSNPRTMGALVIVTLIAGLMVPIYTDEVAWRIELSRFVEDGWIDHGIGETCGPNMNAVPPLFMWPVRLFSSGVTWLVTNPLWVRIAGIANAVLILLLFRSLVRVLFPDPRRSARLRLLTYAMLGLGTLPFLLVWSRPEQPLLLCMLASVLIVVRPAAGSHARFALRLAGVLVMALVALSYHLKTVFYLPFFAAELLVLPILSGGRRAWLLRGVALAALAAAGWTAFLYWSRRFACPGDPVLAAKLATENLSVEILRGWRELIAVIPRLFLGMWPTTYILNASPVPRVMSNWLPQLPVGLPVLLPWIGACVLCWIGAIVAVIAGMRRSLTDPARSTARLVLGCVLLTCSTGWAALQLQKNSYESSLYLPLLLLALLLIVSATTRLAAREERMIRVVATISAVSQLLVMAVYVPDLWGTTAGGTIERQRSSVSGFAYDARPIIASGARCGLAPRPGLRRVLVDDLTYFAYVRTGWPLYRFGVLETWNGSTGDPYRWLRSHNSPGLVMACTYLPPDLRRRAIATGQFCCVATR